MALTNSIEINNEQAMLAFGRSLATSLKGHELVLLSGDLGMGKTTIARGLLDGLGYTGKVKSPTYTLVEPYELAIGRLYHFDFYRINHPEELDFIGLEEMLQELAIKLIEWPERASGKLPEAEIEITISERYTGRVIDYSQYT